MEKITEVNCETGEVVERNMTNAELKTIQENNDIESEKIKSMESALSKLYALGLTHEEIIALIGNNQ
jgi:hypothetical protein